MNELVEARSGFAARAAGGLRGIFRLALDAALPPLCASCREPLGDGAGLCATCWSKLSPIEKPYCARLGIPFVYDPGPGLLELTSAGGTDAFFAKLDLLGNRLSARSLGGAGNDDGRGIAGVDPRAPRA